MKQLALLSAALLLAGCAVGTNYDVNSLSQLKPGMSQAEVVGMLGKPYTESRLPDGTTMLGWMHARSTGFSARGRSVQLRFDSSGRLIDSGYQSEINGK